jgi:hypothetical protein
MPNVTVKEMLEKISEEILNDSIAKAITTYMAKNMDLFEEFYEDIIEGIKGNQQHMDRIRSAVVDSLILSIQSGEFEVIGTDLYDTISDTLSEKVSDAIRRGFSTLTS